MVRKNRKNRIERHPAGRLSIGEDKLAKSMPENKKKVADDRVFYRENSRQ
jgi:hypothetical protein